MKIAIVGGAGARTPLLVRGLAASRLPVSEIALFDVDAPRLGAIAPLARLLAERAAGAKGSRAPDVRVASSSAACVESASFVFTSIRAGGIEARSRDEATCLRHGVVGQETVGPAGMAMAMRNAPALVRYAEETASLAPGAWVINFTNPVGIVTQAVRAATGARIVGVCDTPTELFDHVASELGIPAGACRFDYFGLNHLGWLREVFHEGKPRLGELWESPERLPRLYRSPLFSVDLLERLRLLPTEYLYYYYRPGDAVRNLGRAGKTRGQAIAALNAGLFEGLAAGAEGESAAFLYERYLEARDAGYMTLESGERERHAPPACSELTGYDKIGVAVARAIHFDTREVIPLDVTNGSSLPDLSPEDVVEVPCEIGASGPTPLPAGPAPAAARDLLVTVKAYERLVASAALESLPARRAELAEEALGAHPLVGDRALAARLVAELEIGA